MVIHKTLYPALVAMLLLVTACSENTPVTGPTDGTAGERAVKDGSENLGSPSIPISAGSAFVEGGVGMVGVDSGVLNVAVPQDAVIRQVLLYWAGGTTAPAGDDTIELDGTAVSGTLIGGPTFFFNSGGLAYSFSAYRADVTALGAVQNGPNLLTISGFDFDATPGTADENNGCSVVVIYDDGTVSELSLRDGLDMAYFGFQPTLDRTMPQSFPLVASEVERTADLMLIVASVGQERPNRILVTTSQGDQIFDNVLDSVDGLTWDSLVLPIQIPAGDTSVTVEVVSLSTLNPAGASLGWVAAGLSVPTPATVVENISGTVYVDVDADGQQGAFEWGIPNVVVDISNQAGFVGSVVSAADGTYTFSGPAGNYSVSIDLAPGTTFNDDLVASFTPTTALSVPVGSPAIGVDFGFLPVVEDILSDLAGGTLVSNGKTREYWVKVFRRALIAENSGRRALGHEHDRGNGGGWGHAENYPDGDRLRAMAAEIASLYFTEPYQFTPGSELDEILAVLRLRPGSDAENLYRELLVTELNFTADRGLLNEADRLGVLISWGESLLVVEAGAKSVDEWADKGGNLDLRSAFDVFKAVNTGGGGGVDE